MKRSASVLCIGVLCAAVANPTTTIAYPLDGSERSGIRRLEGYRAAQATPGGAKLPSGALLQVDDIALSFTDDTTRFDDSSPDPALQAALNSIFGRRDPSYGVVVIDISDPEGIVWAGVRADTRQNAGSVGKLLCMVALFDALARAFPDPEDRLRVLRETEVTGGEWVLTDQHVVPFFQPETGRNRFRLLQPTDTLPLSEWIDHAMSASANAAGSVIWREAMLLAHFGDAYPGTKADRDSFFRETRKSILGELSQSVITRPLSAAGIDIEAIRQGSFWTGAAKRIVPGIASWATPRELARILLAMEQGRLVDHWSSLEMKRYLYMTKRRYRYAYAPELGAAAVYFKSGSLYSCKPEEGYACGKYLGNARNFMNSVALVEAPAASEQNARRYIVALMSNVLKLNSAWDHSRLAAAVDEAVRTRSKVTVREQGTKEELRDAGVSD